jgi:L-aminopeptidase/D-esterase-like protein
LFGLASIAGVVRWCEEHGVGIAFGRQRIPIVSGAVVFDLNTGRSDVRPTVDSGYAAAATAKGGRVVEGSVGGGTGATVAKIMGANRSLKGGVGTASEVLDEGVVVGAIVVVNAVGDIFDTESAGLVAGPRGDAGAFLNTMSALRSGSRRGSQNGPAEGNTTIGVVATNARLTKEQANRLATVAHDGFARAIRPVHTSADGDTVFAMATGEVEIGDARITALEAFAALAVERAVVKGVLAAKGLAGVPSVSEWLADS